jgi:septin family protein
MFRTLEVNTHAVLLEEGGVNLRLTVVDTPGKGSPIKIIFFLFD